ncbi:hypothetical protein D1007_57331 [Hordeum vulgare]|nr:hypothetical protein D1007_57331 [Hordeum vulgare]
MASSSTNAAKEKEGMEKMMEKMNLTDRESAKLVVDDEEEMQGESILGVVGKVLNKRVLHVNTIAEALRPAWGNVRGLCFSPAGDNMFLASFEGKRERDMIFEGGPWMVGKHAVVLEIFDARARPFDLNFEMMQIWARVINLPFNLRCPPWTKRIAKLVGKVIRVDVDAKGFAFGEALRARVWINVNEPLMRWVRLESAKTKEVVFYDIQYEALPYFCFSCGCPGHADLYCPSPAGRDANGRLSYGENLRMPIRKRSWGNIPMRG